MLAIVVVVLLLFVFKGGDDEATEQPSAGATTATHRQRHPQAVGQIELDGTGKAQGQGVFTLFLQGQQDCSSPRGRGQRAAEALREYAVWLTGPGGRAKRIGYTPESARAAAARPAARATRTRPSRAGIATYRRVVVTHERTRRQAPGPTLARGTLQRQLSPAACRGS